MTAPLFSLPTSPSGAKVVDAAAKHIDMLREAGVLGPGGEFQAAIVQDLAESMVRAPGYAKANLAKELSAALEKLPTTAARDAWDTFRDLTRALHLGPGQPAPARFATRPTPGAPHEADGVALVAALLGKPLLPWQYQVARVATERTPDGSRYRFRRVVVTVPRQSGKTTLLAALFVHRALTRHQARVWMTAQTGKDATARWNDLRKLVAGTLLEPFTHARLSAGSASLLFERSDSHISPFAPTPESLHGYTFDFAAIDEAFAFTMDQGRDLIGAIEPAGITLPDRQTIITSTAGSPDSEWLRSLVDHGRRQAQRPDPSVAYFEWSGDKTQHPEDPASYRFHPAVGWTLNGNTLTLEDLVATALELPPSERDRAFRNLWSDAAGEPLMPLSELVANYAAAPLAPPPVDGSVRVAIGFDVEADGTAATLVTAWHTKDRTFLQKLKSAAGMGWLLDELVDVHAAAGPNAELVTPPDGPSLEVAEELQRRGLPVRVLENRTWATACGTFHRDLRAARLVIAGPDPELETANNVAATRPLGDSWAISRTRSTGPVTAWTAAAAALRIVDEEGISEFPTIETSHD